MTRDRWCPNCQMYVRPRSRMKPWPWLIVALGLLVPDFLRGLFDTGPISAEVRLIAFVVSIGLVLSMRRVRRTLACPRCETNELLKEKPAAVSTTPPT